MFNSFYQPQFITRQVTSIDEARAYLIDAINTYLFLDFNAGKIYLKRMNNNGLADFYTFSIDKVRTDSIETRIARLEEMMRRKNESVSNDESTEPNVSADGKTESTTVQKGKGND